MGSLDEAFSRAPRSSFVLSEYREAAEADMPLPIGYGQTISQPSTVRMMLEWLDVQLGDTVLDVGSGSGWTTALLAQLTGIKGQVYAVEVVPELVEMGRRNCERIGVGNASFFQAGKVLGLPQHAPFDRVLVSAAADHIPAELCEQVRTGGTLVIPVHDVIFELTKASTTWERVPHPGFVFVPLIHREVSA